MDNLLYGYCLTQCEYDDIKYGDNTVELIGDYVDVGTQATVSCKDGYGLATGDGATSFVIECLTDGDWSNNDKENCYRKFQQTISGVLAVPLRNIFANNFIGCKISDVCDDHGSNFCPADFTLLPQVSDNYLM